MNVENVMLSVNVALTITGILILVGNIAMTHLNFKIYSEYVKDRLVRRRKAGPGEG